MKRKKPIIILFDLADTGLQLIAVFRSKDLDIHDDAVLAVGHAQRGITDFAGLLAKDGAEQALLSGQLGLTLRGDLADQDVAALDLGTHADDAGRILFQFSCPIVFVIQIIFFISIES